MKRAEDMSDAELHDEVVSLDSQSTREWKAGQSDPYCLMAREVSTWCTLATFEPREALKGDVVLAARYRSLAPELARRLRDRDEELREVRLALDLGPGEPIDGEIVEAIAELQRQAARVAELERIVALLQCDAGRGASS